MKRVLIIALLVLTLFACAACGKEESSAVPAAATADEATSDSVQKAVATRPPKGQETTAAAAEDTTAADTTQDTTAQPTTKPDPSKIPADNITSANINPNLGGIQNQVIYEMNNLEMKELGLEQSSLTLKRGDIAEVAIEISPSNCSNKRLSVKTDNSCVKANVSGSTLYISAEKAGECVVSLQSENGLQVHLAVTVTDDETKSEPEETTAEPAHVEEESTEAE